MKDYQSLEVTGQKTEDGIEFRDSQDTQIVDYNNLALLCFVTAEEYTHMSGNPVTLKEDEILVKVYYGSSDKQVIRLGDKMYRVQSYLAEGEDEGLISRSYIMMGDTYMIVLPNQSAMDEIIQQQQQAYGDKASKYEYRVTIDISGTEEEKKDCAQALQDVLGQNEEKYLSTISRAAHTQELYVMYGGFLFLGIFLGAVFMMATVLIIYYKQISEGYEDKERFEIMQKVGMSEREVRSSIKSQILNVFFLPLVTAGIHVMAAFPMIKRLLLLFGMMNTMLFLVCTIITILIFAVLYAVVYTLTAKAYYKIVKS